MFGWKSLRNGLPVLVNLKRRGVSVDKKCQCYGNGEENIEYLLMWCEKSKRTWYFIPLRIDTEKVNQDSYHTYLSNSTTTNLSKWSHSLYHISLYMYSHHDIIFTQATYISPFNTYNFGACNTISK